MDVTTDDDALLDALAAARPSQTDALARSIRASVRRSLVGAPDGPFRLGRFTVLGRLGGGGMGTVFVAYDPDLDRKIALKVLHTRGEAGRQAALREGRALARLKHPNVVTVYEVGVLDEQVFVAMEYVSGQNLRDWLRAPRSRAAILERLLEAGRGLAAAHDVDLVHRDFKPDNVVIDVAGHARVIDFGLARPLEELATTVGGSIDASPTTPSLRGGTPAYMAPERLGGAPGDQRSDQYAFCLTGWEALFGERPSARPRAAAGVPGRVVRALRRGLSAAPEQRFPSMHALLAELAPPPARRWARGLALAALAGLALAGPQLGRRDPGGPRCASPWSMLAGAWSPARAEAIGAAFVAAGAPSAGETWARARPRLERYAEAWIAAHARACEATVVLGVAPPELYGRRALCLADRRLHFAALLDRFAAADRDTVTRALAAIDQLPPVDACEQPDASPAAADPARVRERLELREARARATVELDTGDVGAAAAQIERTLARARAADDPALLAEVLLLASAADEVAGRLDAALARAREALRLALEQRQPLVAARATLQVEHLHRRRASLAEAGEDLLRLAETLAQQAGDPPGLRIDLLFGRGLAQYEANRHAEAIATYERLRGIAAAEGLDLDASAALLDLGNSRDALGDYAGARAAYLQGLAEVEPLLGPLHPTLADFHNNLASVSLALADPDAALHHLERSEAIARANFGEVHPTVAGALLQRGSIHAVRGDLDVALAERRQAAALFEQIYGPRHPHVGLARCAAGLDLRELGRHDEALIEVERGAASIAATRPADDCDLLFCTAIRGSLLHALGRDVEAVAALEPALARAATSACVKEQRGELELGLARALYRLRGARERDRILALLAAASREFGPESNAEIERLAAALR